MSVFVSRISPCGSWIWSHVSSVGQESHKTYRQTGTFFMSSHAYEKGACLALGVEEEGRGGVANMILHNMFVAIHRGADGALWQWKEAGRFGRRGARRSQTGGGPGRGPLIVPLSPSQSLPLSPLVHPSRSAERGGVATG